MSPTICDVEVKERKACCRSRGFVLASALALSLLVLLAFDAASIVPKLGSGKQLGVMPIVSHALLKTGPAGPGQASKAVPPAPASPGGASPGSSTPDPRRLRESQSDRSPSSGTKWAAGNARSSADQSKAATTTQQVGYSFKAPEPEAMAWHQMDWCEGHEQKLEEFEVIDERLEFLMVLGAQKAGTTWLFDALVTHPLFTGADAGERKQSKFKPKELQFFNMGKLSPTEEYLECYDEEKKAAAIAGRPTVFLDATPENIAVPAVPARVQRVVPHAKFIVVLRDPVERTFSAYNMHKARVCRAAEQEGGTCGEHLHVPLVEVVVNSTLATRELAEEVYPCDFASLAGGDSTKSWWDCWRCVERKSRGMCPNQTPQQQAIIGGCPAVQIPLLYRSMYAAQIAWWLEFFPPEQFLILTSDELHDPELQVQSLNKVLAHVGQRDAEPFTAEQIAPAKGFTGKYKKERSVEDLAAAELLRKFYEKPNADLKLLMDTYWPEAGFQGF